MKLRKFYLIITIFTSVFLFVVGVLFLGTYNIDDATFAFSNNPEDKDNDGIENNNNDDNDDPSDKTKKDLINIVVLVGDKWESNTDSITVASYNPNNKKLSLVSIPRDTKVEYADMPIPKINAVYRRKNGPENLMSSLEEMLEIDINYYIYLNLSTFADVIDLLGGVDINIPVDMHYDDPTQDLHIHFTKGLQHLDGKKSELYLRFRKPNDNVFTEEMLKYYNGSDIKRIEAQKNFIKELVRQKANLFYLTKLADVVNTVYENLETNLTLGQAMEYITLAVDFTTENLETYSLPGSDQMIGSYDYFVRSKIKTYEIIKKLKDIEQDAN